MMEMEQNLETIFRRCTGIKTDKRDEWKDQKFFGSELNISPRDLVVFLLKVEKSLQVKFDKSVVASGGFDTFHHVLKLCNAIYSKI